MRRLLVIAAVLLTASACGASKHSKESASQPTREAPLAQREDLARTPGTTPVLAGAVLEVPPTVTRGQRLTARFQGCPHHESATADTADGLGVFLHDPTELIVAAKITASYPGYSRSPSP